MQFKLNTGWLLAIGLGIFILLDFLCWRPNPHEPGVPIVIRDTMWIEGDPFPAPYPVVQIRDSVIIQEVEVPMDVDTTAILADYFAIIRGSDTLVDDSTLFVRIDWMVTQNRLRTVKPFIQNRKPTAIIHNTHIYPTQPHRRYGIGGGLGVPEGWYITTSYQPEKLKFLRYRGTFLRLKERNLFLVGAEFTF